MAVLESRTQSELLARHPSNLPTVPTVSRVLSGILVHSLFSLPQPPYLLSAPPSASCPSSPPHSFPLPSSASPTFPSPSAPLVSSSSLSPSITFGFLSLSVTLVFLGLLRHPSLCSLYFPQPPVSPSFFCFPGPPRPFQFPSAHLDFLNFLTLILWTNPFFFLFFLQPVALMHTQPSSYRN